jgi:hypothetical protein
MHKTEHMHASPLPFLLVFSFGRDPFLPSFLSWRPLFPLPPLLQMYALLAITVALSPASQKLLDENVMTQLRDRNAEKIARMVRGDVAVFDERFSYACPKVGTRACCVVHAVG